MSAHAACCSSLGLAPHLYMPPAGPAPLPAWVGEAWRLVLAVTRGGAKAKARPAAKRGAARASAAKRGGARGGAAADGALDLHAHYFPEGFLDALARDGGPAWFQVDRSQPGRTLVGRPSFRFDLDPTYWNLEKRLKRMDKAGVRLHALSLTMPMVHWAPAERAAALARTVNDAMVAAHRAHPERFVGCAALPVNDAAAALAEVNRLAGEKGIRGVYLPTNVNGGELADAALWPVYARCEALGLPLLLHPVGVIGAERLQPYYLYNLLGNPFDTTVAAANLIFGGVLDRFPRLNVVLPHAGGALPALWGRLQHGQKVRPEAQGKAKHPVKAYLRRFHYDTIGHAPEVVRNLVDLVGSDRVVLGSDYCFDMGLERPRKIVEQLGLSAAEQKRIISGNAARLLKV